MTNSILRLWKHLGTDDPLSPLFEAAPILMHSIDQNGVILQVSRFWADMLGFEIEEMIGRKSLVFLTKESQEYAANVAMPKFFADGSIHNVEYDFVRKDGKVVPVLMSAVAVFNEEGEFLRSLAVMFDNTEAKRAAAELQQKHRMDAIGQLVGGVAHDFNNLLAVVLGNLEFLQLDPDHPERLEFIDSAMTAAHRGSELTRQLLAFGRKANLEPKPIDLNVVLSNTDRMVRRLFPSNISIECVSAGGLWKTSVDPAQLETAMLNILNNARDAMPRGGRITLETRNVRIQDHYVETRQEDIEPGRYVLLAITDTGEGIDAETQAKVFEPFFTTKEVGKGSGLGLAMVFGFLKQSNGTIRVYSEKGVGTTFKLYFPAEFSSEKVSQATPTYQVAPGGDKVVLLAEDDDGVRNILARQLKSEGFQVLEAATGDDAFAVLTKGLLPDLLLTDIVMPGALQGPELAERARILYPDLPILFLSGYPTEAAIHGNGVRPTDRQLIKPVSRTDLIKTVRELLTI